MSAVREGYKMTELGEIPSEWEVIEIGKVIKDYKELTIVNNQYPVLTSSQQGLMLQKDYYKNRQVTTQENIGYHIIPKGYITYRNRSDNTKFTFNQNNIIEKGIVSYFYPVFSLNDNVVDKYFLTYVNNFLDNQIIKVITGSAQKVLSITKFKEIKIALPNLSEQQKIASILSTADEQIDETEQLIVKTKELKKGLMQQLLTKGIGHTEFKQTELGEIPSSWQVKKIGDCIDVLGGYAFKSKDAQEFGSRWLKIANVGIGKIKWDDASYLPEDYLEEFHDYQIEYGDIVMAMTRPVLNGKLKIAVYKNEEPSLLNQRVCKFDMLNGVVDKSYFYQLATSIEFSQNIDYLIAGTDPPNVSSQQIKSIIIRVPSIEEQQKIAQILSIVDEQIKVYEQEKAKYEELKKGLMQQLLTGQIRVKI